MTFAELINITKNLIDETDVDEQIDIIVKSAINEGYRNLCTIDKRVTTAYVPIINGVATLPEDYISTVKITPKFSGSDMYAGNSIITDKSGVFTLVYAYSREDLVLDNDEPDLSRTLIPALYNYAAYKYWLHRKKSEVAERFLQSYNTITSTYSFNNSSSEPEYITDVM